MNARAGWSTLTLIAALAAAPAMANDPSRPPADPALEIDLSQARTSLPIFVLGAQTLLGFELEGEVSWTANNQEIAVSDIQTIGGASIDLQALDLDNDALVCAEVHGWLSLGSDLGREVTERHCVVYERDFSRLHPVVGDRSLDQAAQGHFVRAPALQPRARR